MSWNTILETANPPSNSSYLGVFESLALGVPVGGGASYNCNSTIMGFILDLPGSGHQTLIQKIGKSIDFHNDFYTEIDLTFPNAVQPGSILIAVFTAIFGSSLFNVSCSDSTSRLWTNPYPTNGHVPGESNSLQVFIAGSAGGKPKVTITADTTPPNDKITTASLILLEYSGPSGVISSDPSAFLVGGPTLTIPNAANAPNDLLLQAISIIPACVNPNVQPIGGGFTAPPPPATRIPPNTLPIISLPFCHTDKCRIFV